MSEHEELIDDLASVLGRMVVGWEPTLGVDLAKHPEVVRVMERYRAHKGWPPATSDTTQETKP